MVVNKLTEGNGQTQAKELCVLRYKAFPLFSFSLFWFLFSLFLLFVYVIACLFSLGLYSFSILKHVRLSDLIVLVLLCSVFLCFWVRVSGEYVYAYNWTAYASLMYKHTYLCLETLIQPFLLLFLYFSYIICLCFVPLLCL